MAMMAMKADRTRKARAMKGCPMRASTAGQCQAEAPEASIATTHSLLCSLHVSIAKQ